MEKLAVILVDGFDPDLIEKYIDYLPNMKKIIDNGVFKRMPSVCPPDSIPAWATIYTGLGPAEHGIFESLEYLKVSKKKMEIDTKSFMGKTFWDKISLDGETVGVFNPFIAYPAWDVNGFMISGPVFESGNISTNNVKITEKYDIPALGGIVDYPSVYTYESFLDKCFALAKKQNRVALELLKNEKPSLFFYGSLISDRIKHFYWRFTEDEKNMSDKLKNAILDIYIEVDNFIHRINEELNHEYNILLISDHGHQKRVTKAFHINEWLRRNGYIKTKYSYKVWIEKAKNFTLSFLDCIGCIDLSMKLSKFIPKAKDLKSSDYINNKKSAIYVPRFAGMNPYGGICINKDMVCRQKIDEMKMKLQEVVDKKTGIKIIEWVKDREEIYQGEHLDIFPDIIFKLHDDYGISRSFYTKSIIGKNLFYSRISGGHKREGIFILSKYIKELNEKENIDIEDVHDHILDIFYGVKS